MVVLLRVLVNFVLVVVAFAAILAIGSRVRGFDYGINLLKLVVLLVGSASVLWYMWKKKTNPYAKPYHWLIAWLPKKWQVWILGEFDDNKA